MAVMLLAPGVSEDIGSVAVPFMRATAGAITLATPLKVSLKVTVPEGAPVEPAAGATVAVKVTLWPKREGFRDEVRVVVVAVGVCTAAVTTNGRAVDELATKLASPL